MTVRHVEERKRFSLTALAVFGMMLSAGFPVFAQEDGGYVEGGQNWDLMLGAGAMIQPKYSGADTVGIMPFPYVDASLRTPIVDFFLNLEDWAGISKSFGKSFPITLKAGIGLGEDGRDNGEANILKGTPDVNNVFHLFGKLEIPLPIGELSAKLRYMPLEVDYKESVRPDKNLNGFTADIDLGTGVEILPFMMVELRIGLTWMNGDYAEALYGLKYPTARLSAFNAEGGIRDVHIEVAPILMFSERAGLIALAECEYLVGDAADSPLTRQALQLSGGLFAFYRF